jgi:hypothetical protein
MASVAARSGVVGSAAVVTPGVNPPVSELAGTARGLVRAYRRGRGVPRVEIDPKSPLREQLRALQHESDRLAPSRD